MSSDFSDTGSKTYEVKQIDGEGEVLQTVEVEALSGEAAAKQLSEVADGTKRIAICLDGNPMSEMGVDYWNTRLRRRR